MANPAPPAETTTKAGKKLPLILGAVLIVLGGGGYVGYRQMSAGAEHEEPTEPLPVAEDPGLIEMDPIVVNLADASGDRYLRLTLRLMLSQRSVAEAAAQGLLNVKLRDAILSVLSKKRAADLVDPANKEKLRGEVAARVETLLNEEPQGSADGSSHPCRVMDVYFTELLLQ